MSRSDSNIPPKDLATAPPPAPATCWWLPARLVWSVWAYLWGVLTTVPVSFVAMVMGPLGFSPDSVHRVGRMWSQILLAGMGMRVRVRGRENLTPGATYVFASNHTSALDIPAIFTVLPNNFRWMAKKELFGIPMFGQGMTSAGYIPIDRSDHRAALHSLHQAAARIQQGVSVLVFPEGTRSKERQLLPFKSGGLALAIRSGAPVLPLAISGARTCYPPGQYLFQPGLIQVRLGKPIPTQGLKMGDREELAQRVRQAVEALLEEM